MNLQHNNSAGVVISLSRANLCALLAMLDQRPKTGTTLYKNSQLGETKQWLCVTAEEDAPHYHTRNGVRGDMGNSIERQMSCMAHSQPRVPANYPADPERFAAEITRMDFLEQANEEAAPLERRDILRAMIRESEVLGLYDFDEAPLDTPRVIA